MATAFSGVQSGGVAWDGEVLCGYFISGWGWVGGFRNDSQISELILAERWGQRPRHLSPNAGLLSRMSGEIGRQRTRYVTS